MAMMGSCVEVGVSGDVIPLATFLGMRPIPRPDVERPFCMMEVPPEVWRRYDSKTLTAPRGRHKPCVTEYVLVDVHTLENHRSRLRAIEIATGVQIREKSALRGCYVVVKGAAAKVMEALSMVESLSTRLDSGTSRTTDHSINVEDTAVGKQDVAVHKPPAAAPVLPRAHAPVVQHFFERNMGVAILPISTVSTVIELDTETTQDPPVFSSISQPNAPLSDLAQVVRPAFSWKERAFQNTLHTSAIVNSYEPSIDMLEVPLSLAANADKESASSVTCVSPSEEAWTTVPSKKQSRPLVAQPEKDLLHPLPQRACPRRRPVQIRAGGYECSRNAATGPRWAEPRVERVANALHSSLEEDVDPQLACYMWIGPQLGLNLIIASQRSSGGSLCPIGVSEFDGSKITSTKE